jgi:hypothetical protein
VQGVSRQALTFFAELGWQFPQFPYVAHTRGWSAEDMEHNVDHVRASAGFHDGARALVDRGIEMARRRMATDPAEQTTRAGRKASDILTAIAAKPTLADE